MNLLFGIGNEHGRDDGVGPYVAKNVNVEFWKGINCSTTPENFTSVAKKESPNTLLLVDATDMGLEPGALRVVPRERIDQLTVSTHYMPLSVLMGYFLESSDKVVFIGIQPKERGEGKELSKEVKEAADRLLEYLRQGRLDKVPTL